MATPKQIGRYRVERLLGTGSFATVWLAYDPGLDGRVALKILAENWSFDDDVKRRFLEEARILWRAQHDRIVRVHLVDQHEDRPYFVMDYADGGTLFERIRDRYSRAEPYSVDEAVALAREIAECLHVAHDLGIVHRDLKPSNILFQSLPGRRSGPTVERVMLADFGLARRLESVAHQTVIAGTPAYMAPEQGDPELAARVDERSDLFAANAILYELLAGTPPFSGRSIDSVRDSQRYEDARQLPAVREDVPEALDAVIRRGLAFDAADRYTSALEWADALVGALAHQSSITVAAEEGPTQSVARVTRRLSAYVDGSPMAGAVHQADDELSLPARVALVASVESVAVELATALAEDDIEVEPIVALGDAGAPLPDTSADAVLVLLPTGSDDAAALVAAVRASIGRSPGGPIVALGLAPGTDAATVADRRRDLAATLLTVVGLARIAPTTDGPGAGRPSASDLGFGTAAVADAGLGEVRDALRLLVADRRPLLRADGAVGLLRRAITTHAGDPAADAVADAVERLELLLPELAELAVLRAELAGTLALDDGARADLRRVLLAPDPALRLGLPPDSDPADRRAAALAGGERWRRIAERLPYDRRDRALVVARAYDRLWQAAERASGSAS
jgi:serine/threonine protein kinase